MAIDRAAIRKRLAWALTSQPEDRVVRTTRGGTQYVDMDHLEACRNARYRETVTSIIEEILEAKMTRKRQEEGFQEALVEILKTRTEKDWRHHLGDDRFEEIQDILGIERTVYTPSEERVLPVIEAALTAMFDNGAEGDDDQVGSDIHAVIKSLHDSGFTVTSQNGEDEIRPDHPWFQARLSNREEANS